MITEMQTIHARINIGYRVRTGVVGGGESKKGMLEAKRDYEIMVRGGNCKIPNEEGGNRAI